VILADEAKDLARPPVNEALTGFKTGAGQVKVTLSAGLVKLSSPIAKLRALPEQAEVDCPAVITGSGLIMTVIVAGSP
jgi:hypothetical protein